MVMLESILLKRGYMMIQRICKGLILIFLTNLLLIGCFSFNTNASNNELKSYPVTSKVGYSATQLGTVKRQLPLVSDEGIFNTSSAPREFPVYGITKNLTTEEKNLLLQENANLVGNALTNVAGTYDSMDASGNLYLNQQPLSRKLYKHRAAFGMYLGDLSDDEPAVIKRVSYQPTRTNGNHLTGLYAPAGEVISFSMSSKDLESSGGIQVFIGQALSNGKANNIWTERDFNRMPVIVNALNITKDTFTLKDNQDGTVTGYMGSFLGGPIYIKPLRAGSSFSVTISGGVNYSHYILGYTTEEEFQKNKASSAPYFDLEVWDRGVRHSGPANQAKDFDYQDLYRAAILWENAMRISSQVPSSSSSGSGIDFIYDCFVAAGAAVAFPAQSTSVNCPISWLYSALDYETIVTQGCWGNLHEMNHHFQSQWGMSNGGEVTNNVVTLIFYSLYTKISSQRDITKVSEGMGGWNRYTSATWSLNQLLSGQRENDLSCYSTILHSFGQDALIAATQKRLGSQTDQWFKALIMATGYDMTYYFKEICKVEISEEMVSWASEQHYPMFVPAFLPYQTGEVRKVLDQTIQFTSMQPYEIEAKEEFILDLNKDLVLPEGITFKVQNIENPTYGRLTSKGNQQYGYTFDETHLTSGQFKIKLSLSSSLFDIEDFELILEFKKKADRPNILDRVTYQYESSSMPESIEQAIQNQFSNSTKFIEDNLYESGQNGNAQVWFPKNNTITELIGKLYIPSDGRYRISLRGREYCQLYLSYDNGDSYQKEIQIEKENIANHNSAIQNHKYIDKEFTKGQWVYFKIYVMNRSDNNLSYVDLGFGKFVNDNVNISIVNNAYRPTYEKEELFIISPQYPKVYEEEYSTNYGKGTLVSSNYEAWDENYNIQNLFDDNETNFIHSNKKGITTDNPFEMTVDLGGVFNVNTLTIEGEPSRKYNPKNFILYGGETLEEMEILLEAMDAEVLENKTVLSFEETGIRYYRLVVTDTYAKDIKYIAFRGVELSLAYFGFQRISPDADNIIYEGDWKKTSSGTFGHTYQSTTNCNVKIGFYGTQFMIYSNSVQGSYDIYLDGTLLTTVSLENMDSKIAYVSSVLEDKYHTIELRYKDGTIDFDSIALKLTKPIHTPGISEVHSESNHQWIFFGVVVLSALIVVGISVLVFKFKKKSE